MQEILKELETIKNYIESQDQLIKTQDTLIKKQKVLLNKKTSNDTKHYWNTNQAKSLYDKSILLINECIQVASKYGGCVFGGYVRNHLIPSFYNLPLPGFKDVDLWFTSSSEALKFTLEMGNRLVYWSNLDEKTPNKKQVRYPFSRTQFMLMDEGNDIVMIDVIVSDELPVNDLNVNQLTFSNGYKSYGKEDTMTLMACIREKTATRLPGYSKLEYEKENKDWSIQPARLQKLLDLGWHIKEYKNIKNNNEKRGYYWNSNQSEEEFNKSIKLINDCIDVASKHDGRVFGGYVRNVLVPASFNKKSPGFKDVDLWFKNINDAEAFEFEMGTKLEILKFTDRYNNQEGQVVYPFDRQQFMLMDHKKSVVIIDVIVSEKMPVNDLDVNQLTYSTTKGWVSYNNAPSWTLQCHINNKVAYRLPGYSEKDYKNKGMNWIPQIDRLQKLEELGWKVL